MGRYGPLGPCNQDVAPLNGQHYILHGTASGEREHVLGRRLLDWASKAQGVQQILMNGRGPPRLGIEQVQTQQGHCLTCGSGPRHLPDTDYLLAYP